MVVLAGTTVASTTERGDALRRFAEAALADTALTIAVASADASFRSYWRISGAHGSRIVMDAPPDKEDVEPWLDVGARLRAAGLHAPQVFAVDRAQGFVLMEDLGVRTYLPELNAASVDALYADALDALVRMQTQVDLTGLPPFERRHLLTEMELLPDWLLSRHLAFEPDDEDRAVIAAAFALLADTALEQPQTFMHRDYHSRNLLIADADGPGIAAPALPNPGIIDFQGAFVGPIAYDLASLLRDCYIEWDDPRVEGWMDDQRLRLRDARLLGPQVDTVQFRRWFDLIGLQRHIKVLGLFCRLWYRDGKAQYLADLPLVWRYVTRVARRYPELTAFATLLERALGDRDLTQARAEVVA
jgi:aminoglycoside/choline kinase family phosphotransferase